MKVKFQKNTSIAKAGTVLSGPEVWRWAFPCKGCAAVPADAEANAAIERELAVVDSRTRDRLLATMDSEGTLPPAVVVPVFPAPVPPIPVVDVEPKDDKATDSKTEAVAADAKPSK